MSISLTPQAIREVVESLTGMKVSGVVEKQTHVKGEAYKINLADGFLICLREGGSWIISLFGRDNKLSMAWRDTPTQKTQIGGQVIDSFISMGGKPVHPVFKKESMDVIRDIERKTYSSDIGFIILHSRHHLLGTEGVIELVEQGVILWYIWEKSTGTIDPNKVQRLSTLPF